MFLKTEIPSFHQELEADMNQSELKIDKISSNCSALNDASKNISKIVNAISCPVYAEDMLMQNQISPTTLHTLQARLMSARNIIKERDNILESYMFLMDWCSRTTVKIEGDHYGSLEDIKEEINNVTKKDIEDRLEIYGQVKSFKQESIRCSSIIPFPVNFGRLETKWKDVNEACEVRVQNLCDLMQKKQEINTKFSIIRQKLKQTEEILNIPLNFNGVAEKDINDKMLSREELHLHINEISDKVNFLSNDLSSFADRPGAFTCSLEKDIYLQSFHHIQQQYELLKTWALEQDKYVKHVLSSWGSILNLLKRLEEWLSEKEAIASETNFLEQNHSRNIYLKGIKTYENLNHDIQDNVYLLHNVNAAFHTVSRKDIDVDESLKNRVIEVNNRWHKFYESVKNILESIKQVLQMWDNYDKLKQHLLVLLTEIDVKLTAFEQASCFTQEDFNTMMKEIYQHEEELLKFNSLASHLKVDSKCSEQIIITDVENIQTYWDEILKRLSKCKESIKYEYEVTEKEVAFAKIKEFEVLSQEVDANSAASITPEISKEIDDSIEKEYIRDLLAALDEAEERIDSLENVLSEPTPTEIDEVQGPNYSRLLAACRSSIDVIQHLNHILSENPSLGNSECIKVRTEGMITRWEKIENATLDKELRAMKNFEKWQQFCLELKNIEKWELESLQILMSQTMSDYNLEKFIKLLQKHKTLISEIGGYKKSILKLNAAGQNLSSIFNSKDDSDSLKKKLKIINERWDKLCQLTLDWQNKLQCELLESSDLSKTLLEMELWLKESRERLLTIPLEYNKNDKRIYDLHTEVFALKQQLENCSQEGQLLLNVSDPLFDDDTMDEEEKSDSRYKEIQSKLLFILKESDDLQTECSERLSALSKLLLTDRISPLAEEHQASDSLVESQPTKIRQCCQYLVRVARASIPLQAILLLLLGAAFLIPRDEEEISCRLSNNFASSLNTMLRYPDGPPPV